MNETKIPLQIIDVQGDGFHPLVQIFLFNKPFTLVLDTGASKTAFDKELLLAASPDAEVTSSDRLSTGLGTNSMASYTVMIHDLQIGGLQIDAFEAAVLDLSIINAAYGQLNFPQILGVLGGDVLVKYKAVIDYGKKKLLLKGRGKG